MKKTWATAVVTISISGLAQAGVSFVEYEAATQLAAEHASDCRRAVRSDTRLERCDEFYDYLDNRYEPLSDAFMEKLQREGVDAFSGVDPVRMELHMRAQQRLTRDLHYLTERLGLP